MAVNENKCLQCSKLGCDTTGCFPVVSCQIYGYVDPNKECEIWNQEHLPAEEDGQILLFNIQ